MKRRILVERKRGAVHYCVYNELDQLIIRTQCKHIAQHYYDTVEAYSVIKL